MRLASIRLSGFKSFVDNTSVHFPGELVGVVGPNGCGKSNIIDGVRWVLGESSAKNLRGGQISDVIFNGSNTRPASSQASVELIFENALGRLKGDFAKYDEISVRRQVNVEGVSTYYINNIRCRRKDIVDTFLGTGLGSRGYSIIQQGTISRLVEAKPEELRQYLEEAAGISHYKERRRETENRMQATAENLERLIDLLDELEKRLSSLAKQAKNASLYKQLSAEHSRLNQEILTLQWQQLNHKIEQLESKKAKQNNLKEAQTAKLREIEAQQEQYNQQKHNYQQEYQQAQQAFYAAKTNIARIQEQIQSLDQKSRDMHQELQEQEQRKQQLLAQQSSDQAQTLDLDNHIDKQQQVLEASNAKLNASNKDYIEIEKDHRTLQLEWDKFQTKNYDQRQQSELDQYRIQQIEDQIGKTELQLSKLEDITFEELTQLEEELKELSSSNKVLDQDIDEQWQLLDQVKDQLTQSELNYQKHLQQLQNHQGNRQICAGKISSLTTLLEKKTDTGNSATLAQLKQHHRLDKWLDLAQVEAGWESAIESAVPELLAMHVSQDLSLISTASKQIEQATASIVIDKQTANQSTNDLPEGIYSSAKIVTGPKPEWLNTIIFADQLSIALSYINELNPWQRIVCKNGTILGSNWIISKRQSSDDPLLVTRNQLREEQNKEQQLSTSINELTNQVEQSKTAITEQRQASETQQQSVHQLEQQRITAKSKAEQIQNNINHLYKEQQKNIARKKELNETLRQLQSTLQDLRESWSKGLENIEYNGQRGQELKDRRSFLTKRREQIHKVFSQLQKQVADQRITLQQDTSKRQYIKHNIERLTSEIATIDSRKEKIQSQIAELGNQPEQLKKNLGVMLDEQLALEKQMQQCNSVINEQDSHIQQINKEYKNINNQIQELDEKIHDITLQNTELSTRQQTLLEQLEGADPQQIAIELAPEASLADWKRQVQNIERKTQSLGEINHAAIKDHQTEKERKQHMDSQRNEIEKALATLQTTIGTIDQATKNSFRETFDRVNDNLQTLFPKLLGGGTVKLEMSSSDLLTSGVTITARPPGKRNTSISMLSGGEKAMTAIALVLAIFQLNPAPFCMLDEVDAPLDDINTGRYINTVKSMATKVQFILITHSKITMENLDQLLGITMSEGGVSRVVSVDLHKAVEMSS